MRMEQLLGDVQDLLDDKSLFSEQGPLQSLTYGDGSLHLVVSLPTKTIYVTAVLVCPEAYPATPALITCESDSEASRKLSESATVFQDAAPVKLLVDTVLGCLGVGGVEEDCCGSSSYCGSPGGEDSCEVRESSGDEEDKEWLAEVGRRQGCWAKFEEEREASGKGEAGVSAREEVARHRQIFDSKAAYQMLSNELLGILREQSVDLLVDAVNNDVYQWEVELAGFPQSSELYNDICQLQKQFSYSSIYLLITFKRGLHPFFPPSVEVLRPRLKGLMSWALASHPMLNFQNWDPLMQQKDLILHIKDFLAKSARIDFESLGNSIDHDPTGGYSPAERYVSRLEGLCELPPRCIIVPEHKALYDSRNVVIDKDRIAALQQGDNLLREPKKLKKDTKGPWAAGTGFGSGNTSDGSSDVWDAHKSRATQQARDLEMETVLTRLADSLSIELLPEEVMRNDDLRSETRVPIFKSFVAKLAACLPNAHRWARQGHCSNHETNLLTGQRKCLGAVTEAHARMLVKTLDDSCLLPFLWREIGNTSFTDMAGARGTYYLSIMKVIKVLSRPLASSVLFSSVNGGCSSVSAAVASLKPEAAYYLQAMVISDNANVSEDVNRNGIPKLQTSSVHTVSTAAKDAAVEAESQLGIELAKLIVEVAVAIGATQAGNADVTNPQRHFYEEGEKSDLYIQEMKIHQVDLVPNLMQAHLFANEAARESVYPRERMVRLAREMAGLQSLLPVNSSSSILVRVDENKFTLWRALIFGPEDTPYSGGCFIFDIYFPPMYPNVSPNVLLRTTGGGRVRFNPNLYACGKVCLSLLGTWSGGAGETWDPSISTCFQVLVSIQSLILVPDPYFNEPGYEDSMHTDRGRHASQKYNQSIKENSIRRAMIDHLKCTPPEFAAPILAHFRMRREKILATCDAWLSEAQSFRNGSLAEGPQEQARNEGHGQVHYSKLQALVKELRQLLGNL